MKTKKHKLAIELKDKQSKKTLVDIAASLGYIKTRGMGAGYTGSVSAMLQALVRGDLIVVGSQAVPEPSLPKEWYAKRTRARQAIGNAVRRGKISRISTQNCAECPAQAKQYHHDDYDKPLQVIPLCNRCHGLKHKTEPNSTEP